MEIINQPVSFYQQYTYQIWAVFAILMILIGGLVVSLFFYFRTKRLKDDLERSEVDLVMQKTVQKSLIVLKVLFWPI